MKIRHLLAIYIFMLDIMSTLQCASLDFLLLTLYGLVPIAYLWSTKIPDLKASP